MIFVIIYHEPRIVFVKASNISNIQLLFALD